MTHLRMRAMVSFLSFPWNGSDPVSISNCRATENGSKCSDQPHCPEERPRQAACARVHVTIQSPGQLLAGASPRACLEQSCMVGLSVQCKDGWVGDRQSPTQLHGRERGSVPGRGPAGMAGHGHTPSMGATEDPSFPGGCSGAAQQGGRGGEGDLSVQIECEDALWTLRAVQTHHHQDNPPPSPYCDPPAQWS